MTDEVLAEIRAVPIKRGMGVGVLVVMGGITIYVAFAAPPNPGWQAFLIGVGGLSLWLAEAMRKATGHAVELTKTELRDSSGTRIAAVADITHVDRGMFAFKPSNGFLVTTANPAPQIWRPGLWWRTGRRIGVGGVTPASQTKVMSEILTAMLLERDGL